MGAWLIMAVNGVLLGACCYVVAGLVTPLFGVERFRRLLDWWASRGPGFLRAWAGFALLFGSMLAFLVRP